MQGEFPPEADTAIMCGLVQWTEASLILSGKQPRDLQRCRDRIERITHADALSRLNKCECDEDYARADRSFAISEDLGESSLV